jgi:hypothetical protein
MRYFVGCLLFVPADTSAVEGIAIVLLLVYALGLIRAWELLGIEQLGLRKWLNLLGPQAHAALRDEASDENPTPAKGWELELHKYRETLSRSCA